MLHRIGALRRPRRPSCGNGGKQLGLHPDMMFTAGASRPYSELFVGRSRYSGTSLLLPSVRIVSLSSHCHWSSFRGADQPDRRHTSRPAAEARVSRRKRQRRGLQRRELHRIIWQGRGAPGPLLPPLPANRRSFRGRGERRFKKPGPRGCRCGAIERELGIHRANIKKYLDAQGPPARRSRAGPTRSSSETRAA